MQNESKLNQKRAHGGDRNNNAAEDIKYKALLNSFERLSKGMKERSIYIK
jgi:hypothetical protein